MIATTTTKELDRRHNNGIEVALLWHPGSNGLAVTVTDWSTGEEFAVDVEPADALDAFHHPYAYAAFNGVPYCSEDPVHA